MHGCMMTEQHCYRRSAHSERERGAQSGGLQHVPGGEGNDHCPHGETQDVHRSSGNG